MLTDHEDAFGHELYDQFKGLPAVEIIERDDGFVDASPTFPWAYLAEYKDWASHQKKAMRYANGRTLDIGCGGGRFALHLQKKGLDVVGIDNSPLAVKVSRMRGLHRTTVKSITDIDPTLGKFDTILMLGNNFGLLGGYQKAKRLLKRLDRMTNTNARMIVETIDPYRYADRSSLDYYRRNRERGRMSGQLRIRVRYKRYATPWFDYLLVSKREMKSVLKGTGWGIAGFLDSRISVYIGILEKIGNTM